MRVCRYHGGKVKVGADAPQFKTGRYSKHLPKRLLAKYEQALKDPERLNLLDEIAVLDARVSDLFERLNAGDNEALVPQLTNGISVVAKAMRRRDWGEAMSVMVDLEKLANSPSADTEVWKEYWGLVDRRQRLVESERRRLVELRQYMNASEVTSLVMGIIGIITRHVRDATVLRDIHVELKELLETKREDESRRQPPIALPG